MKTLHTLQDLKELFADKSPLSVQIEINGFTGFRTTLIDELTPEEIEMLYKIHAPSEKDVEAEYNALKEDFIKKEWKSNVLALAEKAKIKEKGSFHTFNNWMLSCSKFKKHLNSHSIEELKELHRQLRGVMQNNIRSSKNPMTVAWWQQGEKLKQFN